MNKASNFPQVDIAYVIHYPQPEELHDLSEDIPCGIELTNLDKAYLVSQDPHKVVYVLCRDSSLARPVKRIYPRIAKDDCNFEEALGIIHAPKDVKAQVL